MNKKYDDMLLLGYIEGDLDPADLERVEAMVRADPAVGELLRGLAADREAVRSLPREAPPRELLAGVTQRLERSMLLDPADRAGDEGTAAREAGAGDSWRYIAYGGVAAAVVLLLGLGVTSLVTSGLLRDAGEMIAMNEGPASSQAEAEPLATSRRSTVTDRVEGEAEEVAGDYASREAEGVTGDSAAVRAADGGEGRADGQDDKIRAIRGDGALASLDSGRPTRDASASGPSAFKSEADVADASRAGGIGDVERFGRFAGAVAGEEASEEAGHYRDTLTSGSGEARPTLRLARLQQSPVRIEVSTDDPTVTQEQVLAWAESNTAEVVVLADADADADIEVNFDVDFAGGDRGGDAQAPSRFPLSDAIAERKSVTRVPTDRSALDGAELTGPSDSEAPRTPSPDGEVGKANGDPAAQATRARQALVVALAPEQVDELVVYLNAPQTMRQQARVEPLQAGDQRQLDNVTDRLQNALTLQTPTNAVTRSKESPGAASGGRARSNTLNELAAEGAPSPDAMGDAPLEEDRLKFDALRHEGATPSVSDEPIADEATTRQPGELGADQRPIADAAEGLSVEEPSLPEQEVAADRDDSIEATSAPDQVEGVESQDLAGFDWYEMLRFHLPHGSEPGEDASPAAPAASREAETLGERSQVLVPIWIEHVPVAEEAAASSPPVADD